MLPLLVFGAEAEQPAPQVSVVPVQDLGAQLPDVKFQSPWSQAKVALPSREDLVFEMVREFPLALPLKDPWQASPQVTDFAAHPAAEQLPEV